ncbi:MAG: hypothetical protein PVJ75_14820 [Chloroflexota bacterium]|jgi:hypothetical protein
MGKALYRTQLNGRALAGLALLLYLGTLSRHYSADSVLYALRIEGGDLGRILDPTHLLIEPLGLGWYRLWQGLGWQAGALIPLQAINALAGAAAAGLLYEIGRGISGSRRIGGAAAAGFAVSGGLWLLSVEAEFVTVPLAAALLVLWLVLTPPERLARRPLTYAVTLGAAIALAALFYLNGVMLVAVAAVGLMVQPGRSRRARLAQIAIMLLAAGAICLPVGAALLLQRSWTAWADKMWQDGGQGYLAFEWLDIPHGGYAFLRSLALFPGQALNDSGRAFLNEATWGQRLAFGATYGVVLLVALAPVYLALRLGRRLWRNMRREVIVLLAWSIIYGAFAIYWVPGDISFWAPLLAAWWLLAALVMAVATSNGAVATSNGVAAASGGVGREADERRRFWVRRPALAALALAALLAAVNAATVIGPRHNLATNSAHRLALEVAEETTAEDLIIVDGDDMATLYLAYFGRRTVLPAVGLPDDPQEIAVRFENWIAGTRAGGGQVYLLRDRQLVFIRP